MFHWNAFCLLLTTEMSVNFEVKRERSKTSLDVKIRKYSNPQWNEAKDNEGFREGAKRMEKENTEIKMMRRLLWY